MVGSREASVSGGKVNWQLLKTAPVNKYLPPFTFDHLTGVVNLQTFKHEKKILGPLQMIV